MYNNEPEESTDKIEKCERTFITFTDEHVFQDIFNPSKSRPYLNNICPITR